MSSTVYHLFELPNRPEELIDLCLCGFQIKFKMKHPTKKDEKERPVITQAELLMAEDRALRVGDFSNFPFDHFDRSAVSLEL